MTGRWLIPVSVVALLGSIVVAPVVSAAPMVEKDITGSCSGSARWELDIERERQRVYIDFSIDQAEPREKWTVRVQRNGEQIALRSVRTDSDGELDVARTLLDTSGPDRFLVRATSDSGQVCKASMRI